MKQEVLVNICSSLLIVLFLYTGLTKLYGHDSFERVLTKTPLLSSVAKFIAWTLPLAEIVLAILLAFKQTCLAGLYLSAILLCCFTIYLVFMILNYPKLPCHCGGVISKMSWKQHIPFNIFFFIIALVGIKLNRQLKRRVQFTQLNKED